MQSPAPVPAVARCRRRRSTGSFALLLAVLAGIGVPGAAARDLPGHAAAVRPAGQRLTPRPHGFGQMLWWQKALHLRRAHRTATGEGATVAVIDDSLDPSVPELRGQKILMRRSCAGTRSEPVTGVAATSHGTSMVTLVVGSGHGNWYGGRGVRGVAPGARVLFYAADRNPNNQEFDCSGERIARLVDAAVRDGADIISASWGGTENDDIRTAVDRALSAGVVIVAAAGDRRKIPSYSFFPAGYGGVVAVDAVNERRRLWSQSRRNVNAIVSAPGVHVGSGVMSKAGDWYSAGWVTGSSPATAIVAGALALAKSRYPKATANQLIQHLIHTAGGRRFRWRHGYGFGVVDPVAMLASSPRQWPDENPLWLHPREALTSYPMWASSKIDDPRRPGHRPGRRKHRTAEPAPETGTATASPAPAEPLAVTPPALSRAGAVTVLMVLTVAVSAVVGLALSRRTGPPG